MNLSQFPELLKFFSNTIAESDPDQDRESAKAFAAAGPPQVRERVVAQLQSILTSNDLPLDEFGSEANRWFGDLGEARTWLEGLLSVLSSAESGNSASIAVKDSHGTVLAEGDAVQVIKDLKVKGGSSDLKRGTLIKKIHLTVFGRIPPPRFVRIRRGMNASPGFLCIS